MDLFLGIDLGTSYFKTGLFDINGNLKGFGKYPVKKNTEGGIKCELPIDIFWKTLQKCISDALKSANATPESIKSISYSSQTNSFILLDGKNNPLTPLILWPDNRAEGNKIVKLLTSGDLFFQEKSGLGSNPNHQFTIAKLNWFRENQTQLWSRTKKILSISDYLIYSLTGQIACDTSTASMTGLLDVKNRVWRKDIIRAVNIEIDQLPIPKQIGSYVETISKQGAKLTGLVEGIPIFLGGLDHHVAAIGAGIPQNRFLSESTGTVLACVNYSDEYFPRQNIYVAPGLDENHFFQMAFDNNGATSLEWYRSNYATSFSIPDLLHSASQVEIGSGGLIARSCAHKYEGLNGFINKKSVHNHGHYTRAILESTAFSLLRILKNIPGASESTGLVSTGGGAQSKLWIHIKSDMLGKNFFLHECSETACLGAAMIGAVGIKAYEDIDEATKIWVNLNMIFKTNDISFIHYKDWMNKINLIDCV